MEHWKNYFRGKKITVMGLGLLGRGVGDVAFLAECGAELIVTDKKTKEELKESLDKLSAYTDIHFVLGEHREEDFRNRDLILVAAGVPLDSPYLVVARETGVPLAMSGALFAKLSGIPIIGVTGTRGKSTVTHMIHHVLCAITDSQKLDDLSLNHSEGMVGPRATALGLAPTTPRCGVVLGGNVRGVSNLQLLKDVEEDSIAVMELDSWQLQGFGWEGISPHIAVFTSFMEDHMNYYHHDMAAYFADKANIFVNQKESDVFITTPEVFERAKVFARGRGITLGQEVILADSSLLPDDCILAMPGEHNRLNAALAYEALKATGLSDEEIFEGLATFPGVPGRLEYLGEKDGVKIYNDNNATTPTAARAGVLAVASGRNVILIMGGAGKELDMSPLLEIIPEYCKKIILLPGTGTDSFIKLMGDTIPVNWNSVTTLEEAINSALKDAEPKDVVLFSPAFASFGMFKNEYDRNDQFVDAVRRVL